MFGINPMNNLVGGGPSLSIAMTLSTGLGVGGNQAQAYAGPQGAFAQAGGPGSFGSMNSNCCAGPNGNAMCNNFGGGQQNAFQAGFKQGMMAAKMKKLMRKMHRLMAQMSQMGGAGGCGGPGLGGPNFGGGCFGGGGFGNPGFGGGFGGPRLF